jgi:hypothetical protein
MKLEFSQQVFDKYQNIKFHDNPSSESRVVPYGQKDEHHKPNSRFSQFCERDLKVHIFSHICHHMQSRAHSTRRKRKSNKLQKLRMSETK